MIWFFDKDGEQLRYEIRRMPTDEAYELVVTYPDGRTDAEQVIEPSDLLQRCADLAQTLKQDGWTAE
jgi:hypothetical protein